MDGLGTFSQLYNYGPNFVNLLETIIWKEYSHCSQNLLPPIVFLFFCFVCLFVCLFVLFCFCFVF